MKWVNKITGELSGWFIFLMALFLIVGFIGRSIERPILWVVEFSQFGLVTVIFLSLAICEQNKAHVRLEVIITRFPKRLWQTANIFTYLVALVMVVVLLWGSIEEAMFSFFGKEAVSGPLLLPTYPAKFMIVLGLALYLIQLLISTVKEAKQPSPKPTEAEAVLMEAD